MQWVMGLNSAGGIVFLSIFLHTLFKNELLADGSSAPKALIDQENIHHLATQMMLLYAFVHSLLLFKGTAWCTE